MMLRPTLAIVAFVALFLIGAESAKEKIFFQSIVMEVERTNDENNSMNGKDESRSLDGIMNANSSGTVEQQNNSTELPVVEIPLKFNRKWVDASIENFRYFLTYAQIKRCPTLNETTNIFYDRLYDVKNLTGAEVERIAHYFTAVGNTTGYMAELDNVDVNRAVLVTFNLVGRYFLESLPSLYKNETHVLMPATNETDSTSATPSRITISNTSVTPSPITISSTNAIKTENEASNRSVSAQVVESPSSHNLMFQVRPQCKDCGKSVGGELASVQLLDNRTVRAVQKEVVKAGTCGISYDFGDFVFFVNCAPPFIVVRPRNASTELSINQLGNGDGV